MALLYERGNDALKVNHADGDTFSLTTGGSDWLWAVTAVYIVSLLAVIGLAYFARSGEKIFHYLFTISLLVGSISYFTIASGLGSVPVSTTTNSPGTRQIFYVKYINWFIGWTPLLTALGLISGISWTTILYNITLHWTWVTVWLAGSLTHTTYKWGYFTFGLFAYLLLAVSLFTTGLTTARRLSITSHYFLLTTWLASIWLLYAIAWGLDDGGNKIGVTQAYIFWGILDLVTVPLAGFAVLWWARGWEFRELGLYFTQYGRVPPPVAHGGVTAEGEKRETVPATTAMAPANEQAV